MFVCDVHEKGYEMRWQRESYAQGSGRHPFALSLSVMQANQWCEWWQRCLGIIANCVYCSESMAAHEEYIHFAFSDETKNDRNSD